MNLENLSAATIDAETLETSMMNETFFNNDDSVVRKMKQKINKDILGLPYDKRMELKSVCEEINEAYRMTKAYAVINGTEQFTPKKYIYSMMKQGWSGWMLLASTPYLSNDLAEAVLKYFVSPTNY